ncbi:hypothetical protein [Rhodococcus sp. NCIMB 12038]|uniref:hypothetical protein n=1 Tax=Rhodococcus sp. NCIMB 12038 TaxID=933800 RepID=UPI001C4E50B9|nr:hypothetical protein [Rhodococcus sp. NCIMB 12038]
MYLQRTAYFHFPGSFSVEDAAELEGILGRWPEEMAWLGTIRFGRPSYVKPAEPGDGYLLYLEFGDREAFERYQRHECHLALRAFLQARTYTAHVYDLPLDASASSVHSATEDLSQGAGH